MIRFGTSGWRAVIAEEFTFDNVRRVVHAIATHLRDSSPSSPAVVGGGSIMMGPRQGHSGATITGKAPVIVGYDTRFLSPELAKMTAEIVSSYGLPVLLSKDPVPTPVVSFQILHQKAAGGINFTASHNPAEYNGIKFNMANGAPASPEVTKEIERLANNTERESGRAGERENTSSQSPAHPLIRSLVRTFDPRPSYLSRLKKIIDVGTLKKAKLKVGADVLYGTGMAYLDSLLKEAGCRTTVLHNWRDVNFGGNSPEPADEQLAELKRVMKKEKLVAGFGTDGDADRFGIMDQDGTLLSPNEILPIVLQHLVKTRGWKGLVVRSVMTSHFIDAVAKHYGLPLKETPVGFKYIAEAMRAGGFLMGGEESGGLTIQGHVPEKDGILACLLMAEVRAVEKKSFREILKDLRKRVGPYLSKRVNLHLSDEIMQGVRKRFETFTPNTIDGLTVKKIVRLDGFKFVFQDDSWMGVRLSGTEPVVRLYLEAESARKLKALEQIGNRLIQETK
jgi:phosphoglucomutase